MPNGVNVTVCNAAGLNSGAAVLATSRSAAPQNYALGRPTRMSARTWRWSEEHQIRRQIDRVIGRALVDHSFASRLLLEPVLALEADRREQEQFTAIRHIRAKDLGDLAHQFFDQFWGPALQRSCSFRQCGSAGERSPTCAARRMLAIHPPSMVESSDSISETTHMVLAVWHRLFGGSGVPRSKSRARQQATHALELSR